jgi:methylglutaconyl-CoA hydratase
MTDHILYDVKNSVATITMNRPDVHNAFNEKTITSMTEAFIKANEDLDVRIVVLKGTGKSFSAGADLDWMKRMSQFTEEENYNDSLMLATLMKTIDQSPKPTIAVVNGAAYGGGVGLVCACDIAIGTNRAQFCLSEVKLGLIPAVISPYVVGAVGTRQARRLFLTAERIESKEAKSIGVLTHLVDDIDLEEKLDQIISFLMKGAPGAQSGCKNLIRFVGDNPLTDDTIGETAKRIATTRASVEGQDGIKAFLSKQKPSWIKE